MSVCSGCGCEGANTYQDRTSKRPGVERSIVSVQDGEQLSNCECLLVDFGKVGGWCVIEGFLEVSGYSDSLSSINV